MASSPSHLPDVPAELSAAGAEGHLVVLVGAGASYGAGLPSWDGLLAELLELAIQETKDPVQRTELEGARREWAGWDAQTKGTLLGQALGDGRLREAISDRMRAPGAEPTAMHRALATLLPGTAFVTTNYDQLLEAAIEARTGERPKVVLLTDIDGLRDFKVGQVLKLHGDLEAPETIVLRGEDYFQVGHRAPMAWKDRLKTLLQPPWRLLLVGYGYGDVDVQEVVNELRGAYEDKLAGPFWLELDGLRQRAKAQANGLRLIGLKDYGQAVPWLERLAEAIARRRREAPVMQMALALAGQVLEGFERDAAEASRLFDAQDFEGALTIYEKMLVAAERLLGTAAEDEEHRRRLETQRARCRLDVSVCLLNLQRSDEALAMLRQVAAGDIGLLSPGQQATLAEGLGLMGDLADARRALPALEAAPEAKERAHVAMVHQLLQILEGDLPDPLDDHPLLKLHAARLKLATGELEDAASFATEAMEGRKDALLKVGALLVLHHCLMDTIWELAGTKQPLARPREEVVRRLEEGYAELPSLRLPEPVRRDAEALRAVYDALTDDPERRDQALELLEARKLDKDQIRAAAMAASAPWNLPFETTTKLAEAGDYSRAIEHALELIQQWPRRAPLERFAARILLQLGRTEEALDHARRAFEELPARGYRMLLARCQLACGQAEQAWETLSPLKASEHPAIIRLRATAACQVPALLTETRDLLERYLARAPDDGPARLELARVLFHLGQQRAAAEQAWAAATGPASERLDADALYSSAELQRLEGSDDIEAQERVRHIADLLRKRFPGDLRAERLRFQLLVALGLPEDAPAPDWQRLVRAGDFIELTTEQMLAVVREQVDRHTTALAAYRTGQMSFERLCMLTAVPAALQLERFFREADAPEKPGPLSPPIAIGKPPPDFLGAHLLVGELELLLLHKLKLLRTLRTALGPAGRLLVFEDVLERVHAGVYPHHVEEGPRRLAAELQRTIGAGRGEGWIEIIPRPRAHTLPPVRSDIPAEIKERLEPQREEVARALSCLEALVGQPERRLLNADYFVDARLGTYPEVALALTWPKERTLAAAAFEVFTDRLEEPRARAVHLPQLVRTIVHSQERQQQLLLHLASLGFTDALDRRALQALARRPEGLDAPIAQKALAGAERIPRERTHPGALVARVYLADAYSRAIWQAFCDDAWSAAERESLAGRLLGRAEAVDEAAAADMLDLTIQFIAGLTMTHRDESVASRTDEAVLIRLESRAGRLWTYLSSWAGSDGRRHASYGRALCEAWRLAEQWSGPDGPRLGQFAPLLLPGWHATTTNLCDLEIAAPAILSSRWSDRPLQDMGAHLRDWQGRAAKLEYEQVLVRGVDIVEKHPEIAALREDVLTYPFLPSGLEHAVRVYVPPEAVLLRTSSDRLPKFARHLARLQGLHDGRAYELLTSIADAPEDRDRARRYAQTTVVAPWRMVREDPALIRTWRTRPDDGRTFPNSLDDLRAMLSEPPGPLPERESMRDVVVARITDDGIWTADKRADGDLLFEMTCEVPGALPSLTAHPRVDDPETYASDIALAIERLRAPQERPVGQLCADIFFLRLAAARAPLVDIPLASQRAASPEREDDDDGALEHNGRVRKIDLREELPTLLANVLQATMEPPPADSLARLEPELLRLCGDVVVQLSYWPPVPLKDGLWLTHRLYRWLCAQLEALEPDARHAGLRALERVCPPPIDVPQEDLLHPSNTQRERWDLRLASILLALAYMDSVARARQEPEAGAEPTESAPLRSASSAALESLLLELAARPLTGEERRLRRLGLQPSLLDWHGPAAVPDLALMALLKLSSERFVDLPADARLRWITELPLRAGDLDAANPELTGRILGALARTARHLPIGEQLALEDRLRRMEGEQARFPRWVLLTELYGAGRRHLADEVRTLLLDNLREGAAPVVFSSYLAALSRQAPDRIEPEAEHVLAAVQADQVDPIPFAVGIGGAIFRGDPAGIPALQRLLRGLAGRPPFQADEHFLQILHTLGLSPRS